MEQEEQGAAVSDTENGQNEQKVVVRRSRARSSRGTGRRRRAKLPVLTTLAHCFALSFSGLHIFGVIYSIVLLPLILLAFTIEDKYVLVAGIMVFLLQPVATGAIIYGVFRRLKNEKVSIGKSLATGLSRMLPLLGVALMIGLIAGLITIIPMMLASFIASAMVSTGLETLSLIIVWAGLIPAMMVYCMYYAAAPAVVVEDIGVFESLKRSKRLTLGNRWRIFVFILLFFIIQFTLNTITSAAGIETTSAAGNGYDGASVDLTASYYILDYLFAIICGILSAVAASLIYYNLKVQIEGADEDKLASVLD